MSDPQELPPKEDNEIIYLPNETNQIKGLNDSNDSALSEIMRTSFYNLLRYSQNVRNQIIYDDIISTFTNQLELFSSTFHIRRDNIDIFFRILQNEKIEITNEQYCDLYRLSEHFGVICLTSILKNYFKRHVKNIDFIINILYDQISTQTTDIITKSEISKEMEECLSRNVNECFLNQNFCKLPTSTIYRIVEKSDTSEISSDLLYEFISKNIEERFTLLLFLNLRNLSDEKFNGLHELFENQKETKTNNFTDYLPIDLDYIKYLKDDNKRKEELNIQLENEMEDKNTKIDQLQSQIEEMKKKIEELQSHNQNLENRLKNAEEERNNLKEKDKALTDKIQSIIPSINEDIVSIVERDVRFSHDIRNVFTNGSDKEIIGYICKDTKFSSAIRNIFKSGNDSWINNQIEEYHNQIPQLKNKINILEKENQFHVNLSADLKTNLQNLQQDHHKLNDDYQNLQKKVQKIEEERDDQIAKIKDLVKNEQLIQELSTKNTELMSQMQKESQDYIEIIKLLLPHISDINTINEVLLIACKLCKAELVKYLLSNSNIDINYQDIFNYI